MGAEYWTSDLAHKSANFSAHEFQCANNFDWAQSMRKQRCVCVMVRGWASYPLGCLVSSNLEATRAYELQIIRLLKSAELKFSHMRSGDWSDSAQA